MKVSGVGNMGEERGYQPETTAHCRWILRAQDGLEGHAMAPFWGVMTLEWQGAGGRLTRDVSPKGTRPRQSRLLVSEAMAGPYFDKHVFVCTNERAPDNPRGCCKSKGADAVRNAFKSLMAERNVSAMRANQAGCLDQCEHGVTVVVYPEQIWYGGVTVADVPEIVDKHLVGGVPVERLRLRR